MNKIIHFTLNGDPVEALAPVNMTMVDFLRKEMHLTGTKRGCEEGECGACTILLDGRAVPSCIMLAMEADGDLTDDDNLTGRLTSLDFNILDKVWLKGSISSIDRFARYLESAGANSRDEAAYKADLERLYPFSERGYYGEEWYCEPVLVFPDGSSYSTMQSYFADGFFESVIESFKKLGDDFVRVFDQEAGA